MTTQFKVIGIYGRMRNPGVIESLKTLIQYLTALNLEMIIDADTAKALSDTNLKSLPASELSKHVDFLIVVGGDGSLLHAAHAVIHREIPVLGINRGRLGFLTDIHPAELEKIKAILNGDYKLEKRFLLEATVECQGKEIGKSAALNEVALIPDSLPHMTEFEIFIDDEFVCSQDSDGLIVATPTGSTAYALSAGGPILQPTLDAIVLVPMFPHTLSMRPIVIDASHQLTIAITPNNSATPRLSCDSQSLIQVPKGSKIHIKKKAQQLHLIHPNDYNYYETLRSKLHWGQKLYYTA